MDESSIKITYLKEADKQPVMTLEAPTVQAALRGIEDLLIGLAENEEIPVEHMLCLMATEVAGICRTKTNSPEGAEREE